VPERAPNEPLMMSRGAECREAESKNPVPAVKLACSLLPESPRSLAAFAKQASGLCSPEFRRRCTVSTGIFDSSRVRGMGCE
jgi:hypothetical protein